MLDKKQRAFVIHAKNMFKPDFLDALREQLIASESQQFTQGISEREKHALERGESTDKLRMNNLWYEIWKNSQPETNLLEILAPFQWVTYPVQVRHVRKTNHHVPWHQDIGYMRLLGERGHQQVITCFVPLEPKPYACTTIQFALDNIHHPDQEYPHVPLAGFGAGIHDMDFNDVKHFDLQLGDALIFGDYTLHRTFLPENCQINRRSLEFRLIMPEHAIDTKDYFDLNQNAFIKFAKTVTA